MTYMLPFSHHSCGNLSYKAQASRIECGLSYVQLSFKLKVIQFAVIVFTFIFSFHFYFILLKYDPSSQVPLEVLLENLALCFRV